MNDQTVYAVVDIETTGTDLKKDKIIQFACVFVQNRKIINYFSSDINPLRSIPKQIEKLTGISNKQVATAPYFEDIAPTIIELLSDCVFVAHNVYFDFSFLNSELKRAQVNELNVDCLDTVELAQILFPVAPGFRVTDLAKYLMISHKNPHQAISDAYVTAEIFIRLLNKLDTIPLVTLSKMQELSRYLGVENYQVFEQAKLKKELMMDHDPLIGIKTIEMISLRIKDDSFKKMLPDIHADYPFGDKKKRLANKVFQFKENQSAMMDAIYRFITKEKHEKNLIVEAATGNGKTLGYLFPTSYLIPRKRPIIIATSTILLQEQVKDSSLLFLEKVIQREVKSVILKSSRHFIDLEKFYKTLLLEPIHQKKYVLNQMAILTWLISTKTGDLDELTIDRNQQLFDQIRHQGIQSIQSNSLFIEEDFVSYLNKKKESADFIIVNHAFLCEETKRGHPLLKKTDVLIIDEAHKLGTALENSVLDVVYFKQLYKLIRQMETPEELIAYLNEINQYHLIKMIKQLDVFLHYLREDLKLIEHFFVNFGNLGDKKEEILFEKYGELTEWPISIQKIIKALPVRMREINEVIERFLSESLMTRANQLNKAYFLLEDYINILQIFTTISGQLIVFFNENRHTQARWLALEKHQLVLYQMNFSQVDITQTTWYHKFSKIIFTSGSLQLDIDSHYFEEQLKLPSSRKISFEDSFSYEKKAELLVVTQSGKQDFTNTKEYVDYLARAIYDCYQVKKGSILVLFTSHQMIKQVYSSLNHLFVKENVNIYAQNITGTKEKLIKRFKKSNGGIILGANSFWEGIDINLPQLNLVIMVKLPFDPPDRPIIDAKYRYLEKNGNNSFYAEAIPQAGARLRQGIGRLLRNNQNKGLILIFDERLKKASYSSQLLAYIPKKLPIKEMPLNDSLIEIHRFFTEKEE